MKFSTAPSEHHDKKSLPVRERGLKFNQLKKVPEAVAVAPCAGAWVEITESVAPSALLPVAPCAGAWVEMTKVCAPEAKLLRRSLCGSVG